MSDDATAVLPWVQDQAGWWLCWSDSTTAACVEPDGCGRWRWTVFEPDGGEERGAVIGSGTRDSAADAKRAAACRLEDAEYEIEGDDEVLG